MTSNTLTLYVFLSYVVLSNQNNYTSSCPDIHEALALLDSLEGEKQRTFPELLYSSKVRKSSICPLQEYDRVFDGAEHSRLVSVTERLEKGRTCLFGEEKWSEVVGKIKKQATGERITENHDPGIYVIPDFLTSHQCQELVNLHHKISESVTSNKWLFSTTQQLLDAVYRASLSPLEYNFSDSSTESCSGGMLEGGDLVGRKLTKVLNYSSSVLVPRGESSMVDNIESYIEQTIGLPRPNAFHTQLLKYETNSQYKNHTDCHAIENDRMATIIIYLTDVEEGGNTAFPFLKQSVKPKRGMAVVWKNLDNHGRCDEKTTHIAMAVKKGTKYVFQKWFYERPILPQYQHSDFTFCDLSLSCRQYIYNKSTAMAVKAHDMYMCPLRLRAIGSLTNKQKLKERDNLKPIMYMIEGQKAASYSLAAKFYEQALHEQPLHSGSLILYADALLQLGYIERALPYLIRKNLIYLD